MNEKKLYFDLIIEQLESIENELLNMLEEINIDDLYVSSFLNEYKCCIILGKREINVLTQEELNLNGDDCDKLDLKNVYDYIYTNKKLIIEKLNDVTLFIIKSFRIIDNDAEIVDFYKSIYFGEELIVDVNRKKYGIDINLIFNNASLFKTSYKNYSESQDIEILENINFREFIDDKILFQLLSNFENVNFDLQKKTIKYLIHEKNLNNDELQKKFYRININEELKDFIIAETMIKKMVKK